MKIVINKCYGGFSVSKKVIEELGFDQVKDDFIFGVYLDNKMFGIKSDNWDEFRADQRLIAAIEKIGIEESSGIYAKLEIVDIPEGVEWEIDDYDGIESIREQSRSWS